MEQKSDSFLSIKTTLSKEELRDRIKGCIYGAALGDAFGLSTEFMSKVTAKHLYGVGPIKFGSAEGFEFWRDGHRSRWNENDFTDDTDQLLLILQCLLANGGELNPNHFAYRLEEWSRIGFPELVNKPPCGIGFTVGSVFSHPEFLISPHKSAYTIWDANKRNLAANGAVMRTAVLGIPFFWDERKVAENALSAAKVTHADPRSVTSAVIVSVAISRMVTGGATSASDGVETWREELIRSSLKGTGFDDAEMEAENVEQLEPKVLPPPLPSGILSKISNLLTGKRRESGQQWPKFEFPEFKPYDRARGDVAATLPDILPTRMDTLGADPGMTSLCRQIVSDYAFLLTSSPFYPNDLESKPTWAEELLSHCFPDSLSELRLDDSKSMGYTFKCLGAGLYAATRAKMDDQSDAEFFKSIITELTLEGGDADTNCAVAGALLGCRFGKSHLPQDWLDGLRNVDFLEKLCDELCVLILKE